MTSPIVWLDWPTLAHVRACFTLRCGGYSDMPYNSFNLAQHVGDSESAVIKNRQRLSSLIDQTDIAWLTQVHGVSVTDATAINAEADASYSCQSHQVCCVLTADCLPVFFCDEGGQQVAVAHAGWRGLYGGILQQTLKQFYYQENIMAYLGPAISQQAFEVGDDVRDAFLSIDNISLANHFVLSKTKGKWMADIYGLARSILNSVGVTRIYGGDRCTYMENKHFFSYRRDGVTGRMANLVWLESTP